MGWVPTVTLLLVTSAFFAGCLEDKAPTTGFQPSRQLNATADTGVIQGVVVNSAVEPIEGVTVRVLRVEAEPLVTTTDMHGFFGFERVPPGDYFLEAEKPGFSKTQVSTTVLAGIADPDMLRIQLEVDLSTLPYYEGPFVFDGFLECGVRTPAAGVAVCFALANANGNLSDDQTQVHYPIAKQPTFAQIEMNWDATQALGSDLALRTSWGRCGAFYCDHGLSGVSPLIVPLNSTILDQIFGNQTELYNRVFADDVDATRPPTPVCHPDIPSVRTAGCLTGWGLIVNQKFSMYTTLFYGYQPDPSWTYIAQQKVPGPPSA